MCCAVLPLSAGRAEFLGCITDEIGLLNRFYFGGETPAFYDRSIAMALNRQMPLVAMARTGDLAYGFTAMSLSVTERPDPTLPGCNQPCRDNQAKSCGSGDGFGGVKAPRVWAVYRMQGINASSELGLIQQAPPRKGVLLVASLWWCMHLVDCRSSAAASSCCFTCCKAAVDAHIVRVQWDTVLGQAVCMLGCMQAWPDNNKA
jgi:hypothetical protein